MSTVNCKECGKDAGSDYLFGPICRECYQDKCRGFYQTEVNWELAAALKRIVARWNENYMDGEGFPKNAGSLAWAMKNDAQSALAKAEGR